MTAGHGGQYGGTEGQGAPGQGVPGQGVPQQGWNAPPPYGAPGYGPAPTPPTGWGAPTPVERPLTVRAGIGAFVASIVLSLVGSLVTFLNWQTLLDWTLDQSDGELGTGADAEAAANVALQAVAVVGLIFVALYALFVWFAWTGRNWARIVLWVLAGLGVVSGLSSLGVGGSPIPFLTALSVFQLILTIAGIVLLALKPSSDWYRYRGWLRATGQRG